MQQNNVRVTFRNMHPTEETKKFIDSVIDEIHQELPAGATVRAQFAAKEGRVRAMLNVSSHGGPFFAVGESQNVKEVALELLDQMRRQIAKFKTKIYRRKSLKRLAVELRDSEFAF